ncbi:MAG: hypothetical protein E7140_04460 [Rikenellaceae bacterium]|nr:hypothetical protein [Rikenellaceae bacterium]
MRINAIFLCLRRNPAFNYSLLTTHYSLLTTHYSLLTTHYSLPTTHYYIGIGIYTQIEHFCCHLKYICYIYNRFV